ncbi:MAG: probable iron-sulfur binding protein YPO1417, partial [uncultured Gemmatimonadetes bacterium]
EVTFPRGRDRGADAGGGAGGGAPRGRRHPARDPGAGAELPGGAAARRRGHRGRAGAPVGIAAHRGAGVHPRHGPAHPAPGCAPRRGRSARRNARGGARLGNARGRRRGGDRPGDPPAAARQRGRGDGGRRRDHGASTARVLDLPEVHPGARGGAGSPRRPAAAGGFRSEARERPHRRPARVDRAGGHLFHRHRARHRGGRRFAPGRGAGVRAAGAGRGGRRRAGLSGLPGQQPVQHLWQPGGGPGRGPPVRRLRERRHAPAHRDRGGALGGGGVRPLSRSAARRALSRGGSAGAAPRHRAALAAHPAVPLQPASPAAHDAGERAL